MIIKVQYTPQQAEPKFYSKNNLADCKMYGNFQNIKPNRIYMEMNMKWSCNLKSSLSHYVDLESICIIVS